MAGPSRARSARLPIILHVASLISSLSALALSVIALQRSGSPRPEGAPAPVIVDARPRAAAAPIAPQGHAPAPREPAIAATGEREAPPAPSAPVVLVERGRPGSQAPSAAVGALATKLRVRGELLAELADGSGAVPAPIEQRLLAAQAAGAELSSRLRLEGGRGQVVESVLVDCVLRTLRERGGPDHAAEIRQDALAAIRASAGAEAAQEAARIIERL